MVNVSRVVLSQRLGTQKIEVQRSSGEWVGGEFVKGSSSTHFFNAIVTIASAKDMQLAPEGDRTTGGMKFLTTEPLLQTRSDGTGDVVLWRGAKYKIQTVSSDIDYGFYRSIGTRLEGNGIG